jgi:hypothetical protein
VGTQTPSSTVLISSWNMNRCMHNKPRRARQEAAHSLRLRHLQDALPLLWSWVNTCQRARGVDAGRMQCDQPAHYTRERCPPPTAALLKANVTDRRATQRLKKRASWGQPDAAAHHTQCPEKCLRLLWWPRASQTRHTTAGSDTDALPGSCTNLWGCGRMRAAAGQRHRELPGCLPAYPAAIEARAAAPAHTEDVLVGASC